MLSSAQSVTPKQPPLTPPALPQPGSAGTGPSFAQFLNDQPEMLTPPAHTDPVPREPDSGPEAAPAPAANARRPQQAAPAQAKPAQKNKADAAAAAESTESARKAAQDATACKDSEATTDATAAADADKDETEASGLAEFTQLIGLAAPPVAAGAEAPAGEAVAKGGAHAARGGHAPSTGDEADTAAPRLTPTDTGAAGQPAERRTAEAPVRADAAQPRAKAATAADVAAAADKVASQGGGSTETLQAASAPSAGTPHAAAAPDALPNFAAVLAQALPTTAAAADVSSTPAQGQVHAAVHSSAFGAELGARVSLLAVDGQQSAELQLNPGDMGPVAVQIVVDGSQAQVSFHAAHAETRAALEKSLPDLAAALQGQGLTLSGGGVFQQAPRDSGEASDREEGTGRSAPASGTGRIGATGASTVAAPIRRSVGLLDTFA